MSDRQARSAANMAGPPPPPPPELRPKPDKPSAASVYHHIRKEDLRAGSALDVDPPFPAFDVVHRMEYERLQAENAQLRAKLAEYDKYVAEFTNNA